ncbi:MAG TPA: exo-alpha-sialidase [Candidatus Dormibacteraeota bacterium]|jgi:photosystem II stability/assembly factor-like uncharacterized protein|nr:exo-alpha-sialidase [Candidatus Dormibacteraeota bacterium]
MVTRLLVGTEKGLFMFDSDESRRQWRLASEEPAHKGWQIYALYVDPRDQVLYASLSNAFFGPHLQRSRDGGDSWEPVEAGPAFAKGDARELKQIWSVVAGHAPGVLWAGVSPGALFRSDDGGDSWQLNEGLDAHPTRESWAPGAGGLCLHTIVPDASDPKRIFVGISAVGIFRSDDGGQSWAIKNQGVSAVFEDEQRQHTEIFRCVHKFVQDPRDPNLLYQQNHIGVYRSNDAGDSWDRIENGLPSEFGFPMVLNPHKPGTVFVIPQESSQFRAFPEGRMAVYRTRNGGASWAPTEVGLASPSYSGVLRNSMITDGAAETGIYFGTTGGEVYASIDDGERWERLPGSFPRIESLATLTR